MIESFVIQNFLSFKDEQTVTFIADSLKEKNLNSIHRGSANDEYYLKAIALLGHNSFGKSNVVKSFIFLKWLLCESFYTSRESDQIPIDYFALNNYSNNEPTKFCITFLIDDYRYSYSVVLLKGSIVTESLSYNRTKTRENSLFERLEKDVRINQSWKKENPVFFMECNALMKNRNCTFISILMSAASNISHLNKINKWVNSWIIISDFREVAYTIKAYEIYKNEKYSKHIHKFLEAADLGFTSLLASLKESSKDSNTFEFNQFVNSNEIENFELVTKHKIFDSNYKLIEEKPFSLYKHESSGSIKYFFLVCYLSKAMVDGSLILIDELDSKFHPQLVEYLLKIFQNQSLNNIGSQLIFTLHNTHVIENKDIFRRDQLLSVQKNEYGESFIKKFHSNENPLRNDQSREKEYLSGKRGGISKKLMSVNSTQVEINFES